MIFRNFLAWAQSAPAASRAEGASALARAFLEAELAEDDRADAEIALTSLLDDSFAGVRRALAIEFSCTSAVPRHIILALAMDQSEVSVPVLSRSPLLTDAELVECVAVGDVYAQAAIALRPGLGLAAASAIANSGAREAVISLSVNLSAALSETILRRMVERFADDGEVRESLLMRGDLPASIQSDLVAATASALSAFVTGAGWLSAERASRTCREASETGLVEIAADALEQDDLPLDLVRHLRAQGQLTPGLLLRALLSGNRGLFEATLSELSGLEPKRVRSFVLAWSGAGFAALYARANLPDSLLPVFRAALAAQDEYGLIYAPGQRPALSRLLIDGTLRLLSGVNELELGRVKALLNRLRSEAARAEARVMSTDLIAAAESARQEALNAPAVEIDLDAIAADIAIAA